MKPTNLVRFKLDFVLRTPEPSEGLPKLFADGPRGLNEFIRAGIIAAGWAEVFDAIGDGAQASISVHYPKPPRPRAPKRGKQ